MTDRYATLKYRVDKEYDKPLDVVFPELFRSLEMRKVKQYGEWEKIVKYIVFMYTKGTPLVEEYPSDLQARKEAAALDAGYTKTTKNEWPVVIKDIMAIRNDISYHAIMAWLRQQKHVVWTEIVVTEEELFEYQKLRFMSIETGERKKRKRVKENGEYNTEEADVRDIDDKDIFEAAKKKDALMAACDARIKALEILYVQFYGDSKKDLMDVEFEEMITPERSDRLFSAPPWEEIKNPVNVLSNS